MKQQRYRYKIVALLLSLALVGLAVWGGWNLAHYSTRWFSRATNTRLTAQKKAVTAGDILDRNGILLATTKEGRREYRDTSADRAALVHLLGDRQGRIANAVESFQSGYLYGYQSSLLDSVYRLIRKTDRVGNTLTLTIDAELCTAIQRAFSGHRETEGHSGAAVVINYRTGEVLALLSLPNFDPDQATESLIATLDQPYWNRATQALYPPGSTFKIVTTAALLERDPDAVNRQFTCEGHLDLSDTFSVHDFQNAVHGKLTLRQAFLHSCNCVYAAAALELGPDALRREARQFAFGDNFLFRDLVVANSVYPSGAQTQEALAASGYGQSAIAATPMHLCLMAAAVANQGVMPEPRLLRSVRSVSGVAVLPWSSSTVGSVCTRETAAALQSMMKDVVQGGGSGSRASVTTMDIRGKTGTAESTVQGRKVNYGWFVGFNAQPDLPFALCVLTENIAEGETGGTTSALIAKDIFTYMKNYPERVQ